jgi:hypothetical protein
MLVSGNNLSLFGRTALSNVGGSRASQGQAAQPVDPSDPLKDATTSEHRELQDLKRRDREVRQHEQAHMAAGGSHVLGGASFSYQRGPDGRQYAVGGEVQIDTSSVPGDPAATVRKMQAVQRAALAPAEPSAQDRAVAAQAARAETEARLQQGEPADGGDESEARAGGLRARNALYAYQDAAGRLPDPAGTPSLDLVV